MPTEPRPIAIYTSLPAAQVIPIMQEHITSDPDLTVALIVTSHPERVEFDIPIVYINVQDELGYSKNDESVLFQAMLAYCIDMIVSINSDFDIGKFTSDVFRAKVIKYSSKLPVSCLREQLHGVQIYHPDRRYVPVFTERANAQDLSMHPLRAILRAFDTNRISFDTKGAHLEQFPANVVPVNFAKAAANP